WRARAERLCARQRPLHQGRQAADRDRSVVGDPRLAVELPHRLDRATLSGRLTGLHRTLVRDPHRRRAAPTRRRHAAEEPTRNLHQRHQLCRAPGFAHPRSSGFPQIRFAGNLARRFGAGRVRHSHPAAGDFLRQCGAGCADLRSASARPGGGASQTAPAAWSVEAHRQGRQARAGTVRSRRARQPGQCRSARPARPQRLHQLDAGLSLRRWRALS
ncbi:hypothetical protein KXV85_001618, partial [Aspergillus fumigatus]